METKTDILSELRSLSPLIAGWKKVNVFTVPQGYFDSISTTLLACLREDHGLLNLPENKQPPGVPEGYFDQLAASILNKIKSVETSTDETRNLSPLLHGIQKKNVFEVPAGYFEGLDSIIIDKITKATSKEELKGISPLLFIIQNKAVFEVPDGYFSHLPDNILKKVYPRPARVTNMWNRSSFIKYAVAAMLTGVTVLGLYRYFDKPGSTKTNENNTVAALDTSIEKGKNMDDKQFNEALGNLTNADIARYLETNGDITDVAVLRNNLDESNLPSQEDYLLDETTLDNFLKEIEKTSLNN
ncbi:MAG: hypothetical protein ABI760_01410 [Ferruginibacter sp.]